MGSPRPWSNPALDVSTVMRNESVRSNPRAKNSIAPAHTPGTAAVFTQDTAINKKPYTIEGSTEQAYRCPPPPQVLPPGGASSLGLGTRAISPFSMKAVDSADAFRKRDHVLGPSRGRKPGTSTFSLYARAILVLLAIARVPTTC